MNFTNALFYLDRKLSIFEETIIVVMEEDFHIGDVVCLTFDETKRFIVSSPEMRGEIGVSYFSDCHKGIVKTTIPSEYAKKIHTEP